MPLKDPVKRKEYNKKYHQNWYANEDNKKRRRKQARKNSKLSRQRNKEFVWNYKEEHPCECGETRPQCLEFHHSNGSNDKDDSISNMASGSFSIARIQEEIDKCRTMCRNCHADWHYKNGYI